MSRLPQHIEAWQDERDFGNGIIVTLAYGWSFWATEHLGVSGFDTVTEARAGTTLKQIYPCNCGECKAELSK